MTKVNKYQSIKSRPFWPVANLRDIKTSFFLCRKSRVVGQCAVSHLFDGMLALCQWEILGRGVDSKVVCLMAKKHWNDVGFGLKNHIHFIISKTNETKNAPIVRPTNKSPKNWALTHTHIFWEQINWKWSTTSIQDHFDASIKKSHSIDRNVCVFFNTSFIFIDVLKSIEWPLRT